jgi:hypothetical protein
MEDANMKHLEQAAMGICLLILWAGAASAQGPMGMRGGMPTMSGIWNPVIGSGAAYEMTNSDGQKNNMEMAIVGKETVDGKDGYWFETTIDNPRMGGQMVMKTLTVVDAGNSVTTKTIMQMAGRPPMEMSSMMQGQGRGGRTPQSTYSDIRSRADDLGSETVTVPAGTFTAEHYKQKDGSGEVWISNKVAPFGLIKSVGKDSTMVLTKVITDAKDKITGTPVPFNPAMMMGGGGPPQQ